MTEIPEHLLKRSRERRSAMGQPSEGGDEAGSSAAAAPAASPAASAPAVAGPAAAAPVPAAPRAPVVRTEPAPVAAARRRNRVPVWAMPVVAALPLWLFVYVNAMTRQPKKVTGPLAVGAATYTSSCSACHGSDGGGGAGRKLSDGEVLKTFPNIEDQIRFVYNGSQAYTGKAFGDPNRAGGPHVAGVQYPVGGMPAWGAQAPNSNHLTDADVLGAVCEERFGIGGAQQLEGAYAKEFAQYCAPDAPKWLAVEEGGFTGAKINLDAATAPTSKIFGS